MVQHKQQTFSCTLLTLCILLVAVSGNEQQQPVRLEKKKKKNVKYVYLRIAADFSEAIALAYRAECCDFSNTVPPKNGDEWLDAGTQVPVRTIPGSAPLTGFGALGRRACSHM